MANSESPVSTPEPKKDAIPTVARRAIGLWASAAAVSLWLCALFVGWALGGAVHLLLLVPLWIRPWRLG